MKGGTTGEAFQEQCFQWERGASAGVDVVLYTFKILYMVKNIYNTEEKEKKQHSMMMIKFPIMHKGPPKQNCESTRSFSKCVVRS